MTSSEIALRRLLSKREAEPILASFAGLLPGQRAAVLDLDGQLLAQHSPTQLADGWLLALGPALQSRPPEGMLEQPVCLDGAACYALVVDRQNMGWLVVDSPTPAGHALQAMLALLLRERVEKRHLASETLDRYREVNLLYHLAERFGASLDAGELLQIALAEAQRVIRAGCGMVWLTAAGIQPTAQAASFGMLAEIQRLELFLRGLLQENPDPATPDIVTDLEGAASILYAPMRVHGALLGLLALGKAPGEPEFTAGEAKLLLALAGQAASAIDKAVLHQQDLQHQSTAQELAIGQRIQRSFMPKSMPVVPGWEFAASYQAANQVGGDFYDLFPLPDETGCRDVLHYGLTIADVSGKGIPAALMMAFSQGILHTAAFAQPGPGGVLFHTNQSILQSSHSGLLLTAFYAVLNPCTGDLSYANGGHEPPILYRAATADCQDLNCGQSLLLGARREQPFAAYETQMEPGDLLLLYTDGVTEARSPTGEFFAEERLNALITQHARDGCAALLHALNQALEAFKEGTPPSDDITLLALRRVL